LFPAEEVETGETVVAGKPAFITRGEMITQRFEFKKDFTLVY